MTTLRTARSQFRLQNALSADQADIMAAINTIREKLPFLVSLTPSDRRAMAKLGDMSRAFVEKSMESATLKPVLRHP